MFTQAGTYAPTLGVLGAVVGLIAALGNMNGIDKLGHAIASAFVATILGIYTGYVLWLPSPTSEGLFRDGDRPEAHDHRRHPVATDGDSAIRPN